jgi:uridine kinase
MPGSRPILLGVAGGSGSGKTTVARAVLHAVGEGRIGLIEQDSYYRDVEWHQDGDLLQHNFDHPSALDNELLVAHLAELRAGRAVEAPVYDFVRHRRTERTRRVEPLPVVVLEGILILGEPIAWLNTCKPEMIGNYVRDWRQISNRSTRSTNTDACITVSAYAGDSWRIPFLCPGSNTTSPVYTV